MARSIRILRRYREQHYAVFAHRDHIAAIRRTWFTIWNQWLLESGHQVADAPEFERYGEGFDLAPQPVA